MRTQGRPLVMIACESIVNCIKGSHASHGVAQVAMHSQIASQGTGVGNVHNVGRAMYCLSVSTVSLQDPTIIAPDCICNAFPKLCLLMGASRSVLTQSSSLILHFSINVDIDHRQNRQCKEGTAGRTISSSLSRVTPFAGLNKDRGGLPAAGAASPVAGNPRGTHGERHPAPAGRAASPPQKSAPGRPGA
jgi:hypothetical protein